MAPITRAIRRDEAEERLGTIEAAGDDGVGLPVIRDGGFGKGVFERQANLLDARAAGGREFEEVALRGAAAEGDEAGAVESGTGDHHARAHVEAAGHAVGLGCDNARNPEILPADPERVAGPHVQAEQQVVRDDHGILVECLSQGARGVELHFAVERVSRGIDGFDRDEQWIGHRLRRRHGDGFGDPGAADAFGRQAVERSLLLARG